MPSRAMLPFAAVLLAACEPSSNAPEGLDAQRSLAVIAAGSITPTIETSGDSSLPDQRCDWTATVAAGVDLSIRATLDGMAGPAFGVAHLMTLTAAEVSAQCQTGPSFGTDHFVSEQEGAETTEGEYLFGVGELPAILPAARLPDGGAVMLLFMEPPGGAALLFPSAISTETSVEFDYTAADLGG